ncbi:MAG TPA: hypothetical protein VFA45_00030 [Actinomycetes bacterium]|nr:hypothetical protein [Actinomycetes bacterium]
MTRIRSARALAAALGLALALVVVGAHAQAAWADQAQIADGGLIGSTHPTYPPTSPTVPPTPAFPGPGDLLNPPDDPQPPQPQPGPGDLANPTENPDPKPQPPTTEPPATTQSSGVTPAVPTPQRIDTGLGGTAVQPSGPSDQAAIAGPAVALLLAATCVVVLVLASICWRWTRSSR